MRVKKLKNGKAMGKDDASGEIGKNESKLVIEWVWKLCNMAFEIGVVCRRLL